MTTLVPLKICSQYLQTWNYDLNVNQQKSLIYSTHTKNYVNKNCFNEKF